MTNQGQFLERPAIIAVGDCVLDGLWYRGAARPPLLIIPPLPNQGSMQHPVLPELAWAAATSGFPTLRFDFRGVGASQGAPGGPAECLTDAEAALRLLEENTGVARPAMASFGASAETLLALHRLHPSIAGLCFVSPAALSTSELALLPVPVIAIIGERDGSIPQLRGLPLSPRPAGSWRSSPPPTATSTATCRRWAKRWCGGCFNCGPSRADNRFGLAA